MNEREQMLTSVLNCRRVDLYVDRKELNPVQQKQYRQMLDRRAQGEPLQYIIGHCEFLNTKLFVNKHVLIPRPETELLVEMAVEKARMMPNRPVRILDLGTGSGNIAIALAKRVHDCHVVSVDISREAIMVATENARKNFVADKTTFVWCDMFRFLSIDEELGRKFDMIISNPPYIKAGDIDNLPNDVQREPHIALNGGQDGLMFYREILKRAHHFLREEGCILFEIGEDQAQDITQIFEQYPYFRNTFVFRDYADRDRFMCSQLSALSAVVN